MSDPKSSSTVLLDALPDEPATRELLVIGEPLVRTHPLPATGRIGVGRAPDNEIQLDDPQVSRAHAAIHLEPELAVEDLGSGNGTTLNGRPLEAGARTPFAPRDLIELGDTLILVQERRARAKAPRLYTHEHFETRLEDACSAGPHARPFAVIRARVEGEPDPGRIEAALTADLGPADVLATYAPGAFEVLAWSEAPQDRITKMQDALPGLRAGAARFPEDARTPDGLLEHASAVLAGRAEAPPGGPIIEDEAMQNLHRLAARVAKGRISVLLLGETGVGKEVFAEHVHQASPRRAAPFVKLNCAALSESLLESELFGYDKGAFTGADRAKPGLLEVASGGTVFLDELGEMSLATQAKLLRVIEQNQVLRVGGLEPRPIDVRYVCATNRDLLAEVEAGRFRQDLYYRLEGVTLRVPPLRERPSEILPLARAFLRRGADELGLEVVPQLSARAVEVLEGYRWPGNIRELTNVVERALLLTSADRIEPEHLPLDRMQARFRSAPRRAYSRPEADELHRMLADDERRRIEEALEACGGNQTKAAQRLGISRRTLSKKLDKYALPRPRKSSAGN